jgi:hypothetical protein
MTAEGAAIPQKWSSTRPSLEVLGSLGGVLVNPELREHKVIERLCERARAHLSHAVPGILKRFVVRS